MTPEWQTPTLCACCRLVSAEESATLCWRCEDDSIDQPGEPCGVIMRWERLRARAAEGRNVREARP